MSRFWEQIIRIQPKFRGTDAEERENVESHDWARWNLAEEYPELSHRDDLPEMVRCQICGVLADSNAATWPCGSAPSPVSMSEFRRLGK